MRIAHPEPSYADRLILERPEGRAYRKRSHPNERAQETTHPMIRTTVSAAVERIR